MKKSIPLDEQIIAALTGDCTSDQAAAVLSDAERELRDLTTKADAADVASLSPLASAAQARALRAEASDHRFEADRMEASVSALSTRHAELKVAEADARRDADRSAVMKARDALATEIAGEYPGLVRKLTSLAKRIAESDAECKRVGIRETAEAIGRGVPASFYVNGGPVPRIIDRAPPMPSGAKLAWDDMGMIGLSWHGLDA